MNQGMILEVKNLSKSFGGLKAVNNVSFTVSEGEVVGIIGPNGSGKTTTFNLITGFHKSDTGTILLKKENVSGLRPDQICKKGIARTFQIPKPLPRLSVFRNVMVGSYLRYSDPKEITEKVLSILRFVGLLDQKDVLSEKLKGTSIRRLELARALATDPEILLIDEIAAGLNPTESKEFIKLIRQMKEERGLTILIIDHVLKVVLDVVDKLIVLHHGEMIVQGLPKEVIANSRVSEVYLGEYNVEA
jgi:branched-chain amino acid transport system ATP-binding protein